MKLQVLQENLAKALSIATRFSSTKAQLPVLGNILFSVKATHLTLSSTNLETSVSITLGAQVKEEGELTIPARTVAEIVSNLPLGSLDLESDKEHLKISAPGFSSKLLGMNPADFPKVPRSVNKEESVQLPNNELMEALNQVLFSVSVDETRPVLTGVLFIFENLPAGCGGHFTLVATDGFRLSQKKIVIKGPTGKQQVVLPKNILLEISRLGEEGEEIAFCLKEKDNQAVFSLGNLVLSSRFLEGEFPDYEKIIPKTSGIRVRVDKEELLRVVRLAAVFARDSANIVKINLGKDSLKISAESSQSGNQETEIDAKIEGDLPAGGFEIAFNYKFLEEVVKALVGEEVSMEFNNPSSPGVFTDPKDPNFLHLIMPVKVQG